MKVSKTHSILFLLLVVLIIYFPSITGVINTIDDVHIIEAYGINGHRTLLQILLPGNQFYFRPLIELTYYFDNLLWGLDPRMMHLENVLLHVFNVLLVYQIAVRVSSLSAGLPALPFISALLFAIHPVNTEAISWIAGRTDPLAAFFILLSTLFLLKAFQFGHLKDYYTALAAMLLSLLAKETSAMLIPVSIIMIFSAKVENNDNFAAGSCIARRMISQYCTLGALLVGYGAVRLFLKPVGTDNVFSMLFQNNYNFTAVSTDFLLTAGFYAKKLFIPFPLNFAIYTISEWYIVIGVAVVILFTYLLLRKNIVNSFLLAGCLFIFPAIMVKMAGVTWTPVAERYLYIPTAFFSISLPALFISYISNAKRQRLAYLALAIFAIIIASLTFNRNLLWRDNLTLFQDSVLKSPDFGDVHNELGIALAKNGDYIEARRHFVLAEKLSSRNVIRKLARLNILNCDLHGKTNIEKKEILGNHVALHKNVHPDILKMLRDATFIISQTETGKNKKLLLIREVIALNERIFREVKDPLCLYKNGQIMMSLDDKQAALEYFRKTIAFAPKDAYYFDSAKKLIKHLETP